MEKYIVLLVAFFLAGTAQAQVHRGDSAVTITASGLFSEYYANNQPIGNTLTFNASFQYDLTTLHGIPNTMLFNFSDNFGLGGFSAPPVGQAYTNFTNPAGDIIQIGLNEIILDEGPNFPQAGAYPAADMVLLCKNYETCMAPLNAGGYDQANAGSVVVGKPFVVTPEPETYLFFAFDALVIGLFLWWKSR